jgi:hypothetical protein
MKRGTTRHPKFRELRALLQVHDYQVVGILESLWDVAAEFHDDGDVGRWSAEQIARAIDWPGDAQHLVRSLIGAGWLDEVTGEPGVRFSVHDWLCHCPNHVWDRCKKRVLRQLKKGEQAVNPRLLAAFRKAQSERNRNGAEDDDASGQGAAAAKSPPAGGSAVGAQRDGASGGGGSGDTSAHGASGGGASGGGPERPAASGSVRQRPAAGPPNPRPTTQDPRPEGAAGAAVDVGDASQATHGPPVVAFACLDGTYGIDQAELDRLVAAHPAANVQVELAALKEMCHSVSDKRIRAAEMPNRVFRWLQAAANNPRMRARVAIEATGRPAAVGARAVEQKKLAWREQAKAQVTT